MSDVLVLAAPKVTVAIVSSAVLMPLAVPLASPALVFAAVISVLRLLLVAVGKYTGIRPEVTSEIPAPVPV
jgi:hypothetical protein